ncbi:MAG TPA: hypothetical protein VJB67_00920 [Patescibacteria group bacterium]|nr:hypothetical protein [Patescibacteria group bacterium]
MVWLILIILATIITVWIGIYSVALIIGKTNQAWVTLSESEISKQVESKQC